MLMNETNPTCDLLQRFGNVCDCPSYREDPCTLCPDGSPDTEVDVSGFDFFGISPACSDLKPLSSSFKDAKPEDERDSLECLALQGIGLLRCSCPPVADISRSCGFSVAEDYLSDPWGSVEFGGLPPAITCEMIQKAASRVDGLSNICVGIVATEWICEEEGALCKYMALGW